MKTIINLKSLSICLFILTLTSFSNKQLLAKNSTESMVTETALMCTVIDGETGNRIGRCYFCNCKDFATSFGFLCECDK
jgi:hypothetical protein